MHHTTFFALFLLAIVAPACQKVVSPDLGDSPPQLVIQGEVTDQPGPYIVKLSQGAGFYEDNVFPAVRDALISISDGQTTDTLAETDPGTYTTHSLLGRPGVTYTLRVVVEGQAYTAASTMPAAVPLDAITLETTSTIRKDQTNAVAHFHDPAGEPNYYQFREIINGVPFDKDIFVFSDRLSDGRDVSNTLRMDSAYLQPGDLLQVDMYSVDSGNYNYLYQLNQFSGTGTFNTAASPGNPDNNLSNGAYGYFSAHTIRTKTIRVN